jgi:hypothetical protein
MGSPVSGRALGECNAIRSWGSSHSELTFVDVLEGDSVASHSPVSGPNSTDPLLEERVEFSKLAET